MILTLPYPNIDPVFLRVGPLQLRWYGLMYMLSFIIGFFVLRRYAKYRKLNMSTDDLYDLLFYLILGVMIGGRLGYVVFYDLGSYLREPLSIFAIWQGGMSFHGGFIGMVLAALWITRRKKWRIRTSPSGATMPPCRRRRNSLPRSRKAYRRRAWPRRSWSPGMSSPM